jgi:hypothetical protein
MSGDQSADHTEQFRHAGLDCEIVRQDRGHWCGYVQIPVGLGPVRWTSDYDSKHEEVLAAEVDVWGGITYGPDDEGWVGFDDAHARSLVDHRDQNSTESAVKQETQRLAEQIAQLDTETTQNDS